MKKLAIILIAALACLSLSAQETPGGGVEAKVVSRIGRAPIAGATVELITAGSTVASQTVGHDGHFRFDAVPRGSYSVKASADGYREAIVNVVIEGYVRDIMLVTMTPAEDFAATVEDMELEDRDFLDSGYDDSPTMLFGTNDPYTKVAGFGFSAVRFKTRGYNSETQDVLLSGVRLNDAITGYSPYSLWTGLNEAMRSKETTIGMESSAYAPGGVNGVTNIFASPSEVRPGWRMSVLTNSASYRLRLMATYASGRLDNGWSYAFNVSARLGGNDWVQGVYYRSFAYYFGMEKKIGDEYTLSFVTFASPGERGAQNASTQEVYDLMGDNMYNSNWGYQNGKVRNARVRRTFEPVTILKYVWTPSDEFKLSNTLLWRTGKNGYTALDWYNAQDPRPDYYRNLPSYAYMEDEDYNRSNLDKSEWNAEAWSLHIPDYYNFQHINWERLYAVNRNSEGGRAKYVQEERHVDQNDVHFVQNFSWNPGGSWTVDGGWNFRINRSENYKKLADLLGGQYFLDVDSFAERDFAIDPRKQQNDLVYYIAHGEPRKVYVGDKYGYDYMACVNSVRAWGSASKTVGPLKFNLAASVGDESFWRVGLVRKGLFPKNSKGKSDVASFFVWSVKGAASWDLPAGQRVDANVGYFNDAPTFSQSFISPRTRNDLMGGLTTRKTFSADLNYHISRNGYNARATVFYTSIGDQTDLMSFYDDSQNSFTNFAMTGIDQRHMGIEIGAGIPLPVEGLSLAGALSWGEYIYTSTPHMVQTIDNSSEVIRTQEVLYWDKHPVFRKVDGQVDYDFDDNPIVERWEKHYVPSTPQLAAELALNYNIKYWFFELNAQYFAHSHLDMNPVYRTDYALRGSDRDPLIIEDMCSQEEFAPAFLLNLSIGKSWYIHGDQLGFSLNAYNLLNNTGVKTGGYEQTRLISSAEKDRYYRFDSKYFYMPGFNYMLNVYFRF